jgi:hypothetical protein
MRHEYQVITAINTAWLSELVTLAMAEGWRVSGSLVVVDQHRAVLEGEATYLYLQAMIRSLHEAPRG